MLNNEILSHFLLTVFYFFLITVFRGKFDYSLIFLWLGAFLGIFLLDLDHFIYWFFSHPEKEDSKEAKRILKEKGVGGCFELISLLKKTHQDHRSLIFHTATFQIILLVLAFFVISSGGSLLASSLVISCNLHLLKDEWQDYFKNKQNLTDWLFWQIKGFSKERYLSLYLISVSLIFIVLTLFLSF